MEVISALDRVRAFLAAIAPVTPIKTDDALVVTIDAIRFDAEFLGWFKKKVDDSAAGTLSLESSPPVALQVVLEQRRIDWAKLLEMLPVLIQLVGIFRGQ